MSLIGFFPQRNWFPFFSGLNSSWLFLFINLRLQWYKKGEDLGDAGGYVLLISLSGKSPVKTWKIALLQFILLPQLFAFNNGLSSFPMISGKMFHWFGIFFSSFFVLFFLSFSFFLPFKKKLHDIHPRSNAEESEWHAQKILSQQFLGAIFLKGKPQIPADIVPYEMTSHREPERHLYLQTSCELKRDFYIMEFFVSSRNWPCNSDSNKQRNCKSKHTCLEKSLN